MSAHARHASRPDGRARPRVGDAGKRPTAVATAAPTAWQTVPPSFAAGIGTQPDLARPSVGGGCCAARWHRNGMGKL